MFEIEDCGRYLFRLCTAKDVPTTRIQAILGSWPGIEELWFPIISGRTANRVRSSKSDTVIIKGKSLKGNEQKASNQMSVSLWAVFRSGA